MREKLWKRLWRPRLVLLTVAIVLVIGFILFRPWNTGGLDSSSNNPAQTYAQAVNKLRQPGSQAIHSDCGIKLRTHQRKVKKAIVFVHGYTNCSQQFEELRKRFYDLGYNVLIVSLPDHGLADQMTNEHAKLKAEDLVAYADEILDIAHGLGDKVIMVGISAGGVTTAWAAQHRKDLHLAVIISPSFGLKQIPAPFTAAVMNLWSVLPNSYGWWNDKDEVNGGLPHTYPRYSTRALAQILRLGFAVEADAQRHPPAARHILVVTNANDPAVNNDITADVVKLWENHANLTTDEFEVDLKLGHDMIDPAQPYAQINVVYPRLIKLILSRS